MRTDVLDYELPADRIATHPAQPRDAARMMVLHRQGAGLAPHIEHRLVRDLPDYLNPGDLMVVNESRVLPAYLVGRRESTGGKVTGLYLNEHGHHDDNGAVSQTFWRIMLESGGKLQPGDCIHLDDRTRLELRTRDHEGVWEAVLLTDENTAAVLVRLGRTPLPPYIRKARKQSALNEFDDRDQETYNTVYAQTPGSAAAPTAGLHFTPDLLARLDRQGVDRTAVTLHVGLGTFAPLRTQRIEDHPIHAEPIDISAQTVEKIVKTRRRGGRIIPIGTTTVRALESLPNPLPAPGKAEPIRLDTQLFITPDAGFSFRFTDGVLTNFHLPRSTLLAMVAALPGVGVETLLACYREAIAEGYRFYSYGDAMLIL